MTEYKTKICKRVRELRQSTRLTQFKFAQLVDLSEDAVGAIERAVSTPSLESIIKIAEALKIPLTEFFDFGERPPPRRKIEGALHALNTYLRSKTPEEVEFVHELAIKVLERGR